MNAFTFIGMLTTGILAVAAMVGVLLFFIEWLPAFRRDLATKAEHDAAVALADKCRARNRGLREELEAAQAEIERLKTAGPYRGVS